MKKLGKNLYLGIFLVAIVIIAFVIYTVTYQGTPTNTTKPTNTTNVSIETIAEKLAISAKIQELYQPNRSYGTGKFTDRKTNTTYEFEILEIFKNLPALPDDFWSVKYQMLSEGWIDLEKLDESYYKQPEFIRNNFVEKGLKFYKSPPTEFWYPVGYGTYPMIEFADTYAGAEFDVYTFFHTSWAVETYQGFSLVSVYPSRAISEKGIISVESPEIAEQYIQVSIYPDVVLLEPAYLIFSKDWIQKIRVHVKLDRNIPNGIYAVGYDVAKAPDDKEREWGFKYLELYSGLGGIRITQPQFQLVINVK